MDFQKEMNYEEIQQFANQIRLDTLKTLLHMKQGHLGGAFSIVELLAVLYGKHMKHDPKNPKWVDRDWLVLSKGHAAIGVYSTLANLGYFPKEWLATVNQGGTNLPSHPDRLKVPGIDATTGSLGQGTSLGAGIATGMRLKEQDNYVYLIVGDGELNEGQCWEAFQYLAHFKLNNCIVIIDDNKKQLDGPTTEVMNPFDLKKKMEAFGFETFMTPGADIQAIDETIEKAKEVEDSAVCIILDSIKGQGVPYFEQLADNHSVKFDNADNLEAAEKAIEELEAIVEKGDH